MALKLGPLQPNWEHTQCEAVHTHSQLHVVAGCTGISAVISQDLHNFMIKFSVCSLDKMSSVLMLEGIRFQKMIGWKP